MGLERHRVVIAGAGAAGLEALLALRAIAADRVEIQLVAPEGYFTYKPLSVATPFGKVDTIKFDLGEICLKNAVAHLQDSLHAVEPSRNRIHTKRGMALSYDSLLIAIGTKQRESVNGAVTFWGNLYMANFMELLEQLESGRVKRLAFALPGGAVWPLPLYELALQTAGFVAQKGIDAHVLFVTHEGRPLEIFGSRASKAVEEMLAGRGIEIHRHLYPLRFGQGELVTVPKAAIAVDSVVTIPVLEPLTVAGIPVAQDGFIPVDPFARVESLRDVYAAGDLTDFPIKSGGIATQQADVAATSIAREAGVVVTPKAFEPVLRGLLVTGNGSRYLRSEIGKAHSQNSLVDSEPLWWPPAKISGKYLAPFLAQQEMITGPSDSKGRIPVEVKVAL